MCALVCRVLSHCVGPIRVFVFLHNPLFACFDCVCNDHGSTANCSGMPITFSIQ